jgi:radical SAM superfamily enzyme YgiQ (UPF0313 family)
VKFSFINASPNDVILGKRRKNLLSATWPPLGILYLATILQERGVDVSVLDQPAKGYTIEETVKWVEKEDPDILGFTTFSSSGRTATLLCREVMKIKPSIINVLGGYYATFNANRVLKKYASVNIIVRGEGENTVVDLVHTLKKGGDLKKVLGITFREGNTVVSTPDRPLIKDLDTIPFPDRSLLDVEYHSTIAGAKIAVKKFTSLLFSRGCIHGCTFCSTQKFCNHRWRQRSINKTVEELQYLTSQGYKQFIFVDDSFTLNQKRVIQLCKTMRREKLDVEWFCEGRVDSCSYEMFKEASKAGCKVIYFGVESANQRILDYYNKKITPQQSENAIKTARKAGMDIIVGSFILGAPDETREEIQNTLNFAKKLQIDFPRFNILGADPGTNIWNELKMKGILNEEEYWETGISVSKICPNAVPFEEIEQMIHQALREYLKRSSFILTQIGRLLKSPYRMRILLNNLNRIGDIKQEFDVIKKLD